MLRDVFGSPHPPLLKDVILAVAPIYNTDGNERVSKTNRPGQVGPEEGMGQRANARGLDLNRDFIKLEAPETRALVRFLNEWNPHLFIDTHTTNGSYHRYTITYEGPKNPAGDPKIIAFMRQTFFPEVSAAFEKQTGLKSFYYGNFNRDRTQWTSYPAEGRYGTTYVGSEEPACPSSPKRIPTPRTRRACWPRATSCASACKPPRATRPRSSSCWTGAAGTDASQRRFGACGSRLSVPIRSRARARGKARDRPRLCRARGKRPPRQDRHAQRLHAATDERVRGGPSRSLGRSPT